MTLAGQYPGSLTPTLNFVDLPQIIITINLQALRLQALFKQK